MLHLMSEVRNISGIRGRCDGLRSADQTRPSLGYGVHAGRNGAMSFCSQDLKLDKKAGEFSNMGLILTGVSLRDNLIEANKCFR